MSEKIKETLKRLAADMQSGKNRNQIETDDLNTKLTNQMPGVSDCPHCGGLGYLRTDLPVGHPDFGRVQLCSCRNKQVGERMRQRLFALSHLDKLQHLTFENFKPRGRVGLWPLQADSLEQAYNNTHQFAQGLDGWVVIQGGYGCGKTHLAAAVANFAVSIGVETLFITVPDLLDSLRFSYQNPDESFEEIFTDIRQAELLILDDFGTQNATEWAQEKLFQILNYRYINHLPVVVTTNLSLKDIEERISSRLQDPELVTHVRILAPDYRRPTQDIGHPEISSLNLLHGRTFASFSLRKDENLDGADLKTLEIAFNAAKEYAVKPQGWLVFTGPYGCGKTHLAAAIANYKADEGSPPMFVVIPDLLDHLRSTFSPTSNISMDKRFEQIRTAPILILDDLGTQSMTSWVQEKLYQLFNYRYNAELQTVITTADYIDDMDPRLLSRMKDKRVCDIYAITVPSYRGSPGNSKGRK